MDGKVHTLGDVKSEISIQSISRVFTMAKVMEEQGTDAIEKNMTATSMVKVADGAATWSSILSWYGELTGRPPSVNQEVFKSGSDTNQRNQAISMLIHGSAAEPSSNGVRAAVVAWLVTALYYFHQYALRSAPAVMMPQLSEAFGLTTVAVTSLVGLFYYGYSPFSLVAGAAMDRVGPRIAIPAGAALVGVGALLFGSGIPAMAATGRFLQGAGGVFALIGAVFIATRHFPASRAATLIGATQMFGMAGGSAGQFIVGPAMAAGMSWRSFWIGMGFAALLISALLFFLLPRPERAPARSGWAGEAARALGAVFRNPQSILCGMIAGLLFIPTTIFDMVWGVQYLQEGRGLDYATAVLRSATVPLGWIIGCPLLGMLSDRLGRRKPVIVAGALLLLACLAWILYGRAGVFSPNVVGLVAGLASGAAMLPYTVIKEANPTEMGGTATGVVNFLNFTFSALLGPVFGWLLRSAAEGAAERSLEHYQSAFAPLLYGVALAIILTFFLRETGPGGRTAAAAASRSRS